MFSMSPQKTALLSLLLVASFSHSTQSQAVSTRTVLVGNGSGISTGTSPTGSSYTGYEPVFSTHNALTPWTLDQVKATVSLVLPAAAVNAPIEGSGFVTGPMPLTMKGAVNMVNIGKGDFITAIPFSYTGTANCSATTNICTLAASGDIFTAPAFDTKLLTTNRSGALPALPFNFNVAIDTISSDSTFFVANASQVGYRYQYEATLSANTMSNRFKAVGQAVQNAADHAQATYYNRTREILGDGLDVKELSLERQAAKLAVDVGEMTLDEANGKLIEIATQTITDSIQAANIRSKIASAASAPGQYMIKEALVDAGTYIGNQAIRTSFAADDVLTSISLANDYGSFLTSMVGSAGAWVANDPPDANFSDSDYLGGLQGLSLDTALQSLGERLDAAGASSTYLSFMLADFTTLENVISRGSAYERFLGAFEAGDLGAAMSHYIASSNEDMSTLVSLYGVTADLWDASYAEMASQKVVTITDEDLANAQAVLDLLTQAMPALMVSMAETAGLAPDDVQSYIDRVFSQDYSALDTLTFGDLMGENIARAAFAAAVPEPETYALMLAGLGLILMKAGRRRNRLDNIRPGG